MKINKLWLLLTIFLFLNFPVINAISQKDVIVNLSLDSKLEQNVEYEKFIVIRNLDDDSGVDDNLLVDVYWILEKIVFNESLFVQDFYTNKKINSYSSSGMGSFTINESGKYSLCVNTTPTNFIDYNLTNNNFCKILLVDYEEPLENISINETMNITMNNTINSTINESFNVTTNNTLNQTINESINVTINNTLNQTVNKSINQTENETSCDCDLSIDLSANIINFEDQLNFQIKDCEENGILKYPVTYWIETLSGDIVKNKLETSSRASKKYTPDFDNEKALVVKAQSDCDSKEKIFVYRGNVQESLEPHIKISSPEIIIDDLFFVELEGYKDSTSKTVVYVYVEQDEKKVSETSKFYILNKNTNFKVKIPIVMKSTANNEEAEIIVEGLDFYEREKIIIDLPNIKKSENNNNKELNSEIEKENEPKIISFYTRKKYFEKNILIYVRTNDAHDCELKVYTNTFSEIKKVNQTLMHYNINISAPDELINADLMCGNKIYSKSLLLNLEIKENNKTTEKNKTNKEKILTTDLKSKSNNLLTGNIVNVNPKKITNSEITRDHKLVNYNNLIVPMILGILGTIILFRKELLSVLKKAKKHKNKLK